MYKLYASFDKDHFVCLKHINDLESGMQEIKKHKKLVEESSEPKPRKYLILYCESFLGFAEYCTTIYKEKWE